MKIARKQLFILGLIILIIGSILVVYSNITARLLNTNIPSVNIEKDNEKFEKEFEEDQQEFESKAKIVYLSIISGVSLFIIGLCLIVYTKHPYYNNRWSRTNKSNEFKSIENSKKN